MVGCILVSRCPTEKGQSRIVFRDTYCTQNEQMTKWRVGLGYIQRILQYRVHAVLYINRATQTWCFFLWFRWSPLKSSYFMRWHVLLLSFFSESNHIIFPSPRAFDKTGHLDALDNHVSRIHTHNPLYNAANQPTNQPGFSKHCSHQQCVFHVFHTSQVMHSDLFLKNRLQRW